MDIRIIPHEQTPITPEMGDVKTFVAANEQLLSEFISFIKYNSTAVGLAANQVKVNGERLMHRFFALKDLKTKSWRLIFDPVIDEHIGIKELKDEGCLTWHRMRIIMERSVAVKVSYFDINGNRVEGEFYKGFEAQIWQHEINHLDGVEFRVEEYDFKLPKQNDLGRNEKCPCNSGKKYKQCCLLLSS